MTKNISCAGTGTIPIKFIEIVGQSEKLIRNTTGFSQPGQHRSVNGGRVVSYCVLPRKEYWKRRRVKDQ